MTPSAAAAGREGLALATADKDLLPTALSVAKRHDDISPAEITATARRKCLSVVRSTPYWCHCHSIWTNS